MQQKDLEFMRIALNEAQCAAQKNEVPVGAVLVHQGRVLAKAHNLVESSQDASHHAEMLCLRSAALALNNWRLFDATLYCTLEPCAMCAGAMFNFRIQRLVWGARDIRQGAHGSWVNLLDAKHPIHGFSVTSGVLAEECGELLKEFFKMRRS